MCTSTMLANRPVGAVCGGGDPHPFLGVQIQVLNFAMLEKGGKSDAVIGDMRLLPNHNNVILSPLSIQLGHLFTLWLSA